MKSIKKLFIKLFPCLYYKLYVIVKTHKANKVKNKKLFCIEKYKKRFGALIDLDNPKTFYEKLNYLRLFWDSEQSKELVDKHLVKEYLLNKGYGKFIAKEIAYFESFADFKKAFVSIANQHHRFVVKLAHTSGDVFFFDNWKWRDKHGFKTSKRSVFSCLSNKIKYNYYCENFENPYIHLKGSIIIEEYLPSLSSHGLNEFKIFCNYGKPILINYVEGRQNKTHVTECFLYSDLRNTHYKQNQNTFDFERLEQDVPYKEMMDFCKNTCSEFPLVRVDLLLNKNSFMFCEFTFYDCGGYNIFTPGEANLKLGSLIDISAISNN